MNAVALPVENMPELAALLYEHGQDGVLIVEPDGTILASNPRVRQWFADGQPNGNGHKITNSIHAPTGKDLAALILTPKPDQVYEGFEIRSTKTNQTLLVQLRIHPIKNSTNRLVLVQEAHDVINMNGLKQLAGSIAHDFNNILTVILGNAGLIAYDAKPDSMAKIGAQQIEKACQQASDFCQQLMIFAGRRQSILKPMDISSTVLEAFELIRSNVPSKCQMKSQVQAPLPMIQADASNIRQVVVNLMSNAVQAIGTAAGLVQLTVQEVDAATIPADQLVEKTTAFAGKAVMIEVKDSGPGIPMDVRDRIFQPFFTTKKKARGLGLPALLGVVKDHQGAITLESNPSTGTTFRVWFPAVS